jgi:hypothetical protein
MHSVSTTNSETKEINRLLGKYRNQSLKFARLEE